MRNYIFTVLLLLFLSNCGKKKNEEVAQNLTNQVEDNTAPSNSNSSYKLNIELFMLKSFDCRLNQVLDGSISFPINMLRLITSDVLPVGREFTADTSRRALMRTYS